MTDPMVELLVRLEQAAVNEARAFVVVAVDRETREPINATGPFAQAEQALAQAGVDAASWKEHADPGEEDALDHVIISLWEPTP